LLLLLLLLVGFFSDRRAQTFQKGLSTLTDLLTDNVQQPETRSIVFLFLCVCVCMSAEGEWQEESLVCEKEALAICV
jgi:hypothetical protein